MRRSAFDGIHYNGRKTTAQVSGGHGDGEAASPHFCVCFVGVPSKAKFLATSSIDWSHDIGHNYAVNGLIYTIEDTNGQPRRYSIIL